MSFKDVIAAVQDLAPSEKAKLIGFLADQLALDQAKPQTISSGWEITTDETSLKSFYPVAGMPLSNE